MGSNLPTPIDGRNTTITEDRFESQDFLDNSGHNHTHSLLTFQREYETQQQNKLYVKKQKTKKTHSFSNPFMMQKSQDILQKDAMNPLIYYVSFSYTALVPFTLSIYLNAKESMQEQENFATEGKFNCPFFRMEGLQPGSDVLFAHKDASFSVDKFLSLKQNDITLHDVIIEMKASSASNGYLPTYAAYFKVVPKNWSEGESQINLKRFCFCLKKIAHKVKVNALWFEMHDVYGMENSPENSQILCDACVTNKKNTIFLPCKHSYSCYKCFKLMFNGNKCPMCRQSIKDGLIIGELTTLSGDSASLHL